VRSKRRLVSMIIFISVKLPVIGFGSSSYPKMVLVKSIDF
jgi:hypothetical protein